MTETFLSIIENTMIDDFFIWGFVGGFFGYAYYLWSSRHDPYNHLHWIIGLYGTLLNGCLGGLFAIVIDQKIEYSIAIGIFSNLIYMGLVRAGKSNQFFKAVKEVLIRYLTGGKL